MITDDCLPRSQWRIGKIIEVFDDNDGLIRKVKLVIGSNVFDNKGRRKESLANLERPIHKVVSLYNSE